MGRGYETWGWTRQHICKMEIMAWQCFWFDRWGPCSWMEIRLDSPLPESLSFETCQVGLFANTAPSGCPWRWLRKPYWGSVRASFRNSETLMWWLFQLSTASRWQQVTQGKKTRDPEKGGPWLLLQLSQGRAKARWLIELVAIFELKGSCQATEPRTAQPYSLDIMAERGGLREISLCFKEKNVYFFLII